MRAPSRCSSRMPWRSSAPARASSPSRATRPWCGSSRCAPPCRSRCSTPWPRPSTAAQRAVPGLTAARRARHRRNPARRHVCRCRGRRRASTSSRPSPEVQREVMSIIYDGVKAGEPVPRERFDAVVDHLRDQGAEAVALGCTELSVLHERPRRRRPHHRRLDRRPRPPRRPARRRPAARLSRADAGTRHPPDLARRSPGRPRWGVDRPNGRPVARSAVRLLARPVARGDVGEARGRHRGG